MNDLLLIRSHSPEALGLFPRLGVGAFDIRWVCFWTSPLEDLFAHDSSFILWPGVEL